MLAAGARSRDLRHNLHRTVGTSPATRYYGLFAKASP